MATVTDLGSNTAAAGSTTLALTVGADVATTDLVLFGTGATGSVTNSSVTDSGGDTFEFQGAPAAGGTIRNKLWYAPNPTDTSLSALTSGVGTITCTFASTSGAKAVQGIKISGALQSSGASFDQVNTATGTSTAPSVSTAGALAQANSIVVVQVIISSESGATFTQDGTFTQVGAGVTFSGTSTKLYLAYKIVASTSAVTYTASLTGSKDWSAIIQVHKLADVVAKGGTLSMMGV